MTLPRSVDDLKKERAALDTELAALRRGAKRVQRQASRSTASAARAWKLTPRLRNTVMAINSMVDGAAEPVVKYLALAARTRHWPEKLDDEIAAIAAQCLLDVSAGDVAAVCDVTRSTDPAALRTAVNHVEEWRLMTWAATMNTDKGVAPSADNLLQRWAERRASHAEAARPPPHGTSAEASQRRWVQRWRKRWGGKYGKIRVRDELAPSELRAKAVSTSHRSCRKSLAHLGPVRIKIECVSARSAA